MAFNRLVIGIPAMALGFELSLNVPIVVNSGPARLKDAATFLCLCHAIVVTTCAMLNEVPHVLGLPPSQPS